MGQMCAFVGLTLQKGDGKMKFQRAFTLMELLVVVAVAALLAGIALPSLQSARRLAKPERCKWNQAKVAEAIFLYAEDYDDAIPYTLSKRRGATYISFSWDVIVGRIPPEYINKNWPSWPLNEHRFPIPGPDYRDPNSIEYRICAEGYVDYLSWGDNEIVPYEGAFVCPALVDQVEPKSTWPGGTSCQFSINGNVSRTYAEYRTGEEPVITRLSDVRGKAVLIGDGNLSLGGDIRVSRAYRTDSNGRLYFLNSRWPWDFGPWTHQQHVGAWALMWPCDFYGHPGGKANLALADGHVQPVHDLDGNAWIIEPLDEEEDGTDEE